MKKTLLAPLALAVILVGCEKNATAEDTQQQSSVDSAVSTVAENTDQAMNDAKQAVGEVGQDLEQGAKELGTDVEQAAKEAGSSMEKAIDDAHNAMNSLDWNGTYTGLLPCADCEGIQTTLSLDDDKTYTLEQVYVGKDGEKLKEEGTFSWDKSGTIVTLEGISNSPNQYFVGENTLVMLNKDGEQVQGDLAAMYELKKQ